ncbi:hypothetical protein [Virgibacillus litoralis]|uniref:DUF4352 domain-containing protein n=1 Tax=Virgibacillus litoralis TaxID=578221 RepID=A0ABS4HH41_9BACI|nr:hypothetical protein [Virgibacillus litoralis]MBP1950246.1 hypothetical protein [Virgibacillus litoralis]
MKLKWIAILFLTLVLTACNSDGQAEGNNTDEPKKDEATETTNENTKQTSSDLEETASSEKSNSNEPKKLTEPGQTIQENGYTVELVKMKTLNETIKVSPLTINLKDAKLIKLKNMSDSFRMDMEYYAGEQIGKEATYLQLDYSVENMEDKNVGWKGLNTIVTDKKEQINLAEKDFVTDDTDTSNEFFGQVIKEGVDSVILQNPDINNLKLIFGDSYDSASYETISEGKEIELTF